MPVLFQIIIATVGVSILSLSGAVALFFKRDKLDKMLIFLVSLSAGALLGGAFFHLLPEAIEGSGETGYMAVLASFIIFLLIEKVLHWRHCHKANCETHTFGHMNLFGDMVHNLIDGLIIAAAFLIDPKIGLITTFAVALHEIPQEIGDFGVLVYAGFSKKRALLYNFLSSLTAVAAGVAGYFAGNYIEDKIVYILLFAAGGFIYIGASDLIPELRKETNFKKSAISFLVFLIGIIIMYAIGLLE